MTNFQQICGIDISKSTLDISELQSGSKEITNRTQINNNLQSIAKWLKGKTDSSILYVMEHTGTYGSKLLHSLNHQNLAVRVVSPYRSKSFMESLGMTNKNDRQAADALAKMGQVLELKPYKAISETMQKRKQLIKVVDALKKQERMLLNQLEAMEQLVILEPKVKTSTEVVLKTVQEQLKELEQQLKVSQVTEEYQRKKKFATSVVGIGDKTADALLLMTNCFEDFESADKVAKFFGLTPSSHTSGASVRKKGRITKFGSGYVRGLLFNCSRSAIQHNPACRELFHRLRNNGKPYKVAAVAVMHKLVKQVFACVTKETKFDKNYKHFDDKNSD